MDKPSSRLSIRVELFLPGMRLNGLAPQVDESHRLADVLSSPIEVLRLRHVSIMDLNGSVLEEVPEVVVEKRFIRVAVPRETEEYLARQRLSRAGMVRPSMVRTPVMALVPPFIAHGTAHLSPTASPFRIAVAVNAFFPLTRATLRLGTRILIATPALVVNREHVISIVALRDEQEEGAADAGVPRPQPLYVADLTEGFSERRPGSLAG